MSDRESIQPAGWREDAERLGLSGVLRDGRWLFVSGHTGCPDHTVEAQIREAYGDVTASLEEAGSGWADVVSVTSYHVGLRDHLDTIVRTHKEHVREPYPAWSGVGVTELANGSVCEVSVIARLPEGAAGSGS